MQIWMKATVSKLRRIEACYYLAIALGTIRMRKKGRKAKEMLVDQRLNLGA